MLLVRLADEKCRHAGVYTASWNQFGLRPQEVEVSVSVLYMSMSLDGYIADPAISSAATMANGCTSGSPRAESPSRCPDRPDSW
jgi:hypothetical protein